MVHRRHKPPLVHARRLVFVNGAMALSRRRFVQGSLAAGLTTAMGGLPLSMIDAHASAPSFQPVVDGWSDSGYHLAWIGHSTVLMRLAGVTVLTDPILFDRVGIHLFGATIGPRRLLDPALSPSAIPKPDIILLSHAHMDHMDMASLMFLAERDPGTIDVITAKNTMDVIEHLPWASLQEIDWGERSDLHGIRFDALPVKHFGWRLPGEADRAKRHRDGRSFNAYLIRVGGRRFVFGGDTAYTESFREVAAIGGIDVAMMPIGAYDPWRAVHCTPEEAIAMADMMGTATILPMHTMTFKQGRESFQEPIRRFHTALARSEAVAGYYHIGQTFTA